MLLLLGGGVLLASNQSVAGRESVFLGLLAVMVATVARGMDNTGSRGVADRNPGEVVLAKGTLGTLARANSVVRPVNCGRGIARSLRCSGCSVQAHVPPA